MTILKASRLKAVLDKARNAGHVEESARIAGVELVFRSLASETFNDIFEGMNDVPELSYATIYQIEHVCRSIVQVDEEDFRDVTFIELEGEPGAPPVRVERHQWIKDNLVSTWSREMVTVAYRKVVDAIKGAEDRASEGVKFRVESETDEEKYRRLLSELKEVGAELPEDMKEAILKEEGLSTATSKAEVEAFAERARNWAPEDQPASPPEAEEPPLEAVAPVPPSEPPRAPQQLIHAQVAPEGHAAAVAPQRVPLNQTPIHEPVPASTAQQTTVANRRSPQPPPEQVHNFSRTERIAAIEEDVVLLEREPRVDGAEARSILEKGPVGGSNPKYVNPHVNQRRVGGLDPRSR